MSSAARFIASSTRTRRDLAARRPEARTIRRGTACWFAERSARYAQLVSRETLDQIVALTTRRQVARAGRPGSDAVWHCKRVIGACHAEPSASTVHDERLLITGGRSTLDASELLGARRAAASSSASAPPARVRCGTRLGGANVQPPMTSVRDAAVALRVVAARTLSGVGLGSQTRGDDRAVGPRGLDTQNLRVTQESAPKKKAGFASLRDALRD